MINQRENYCPLITQHSLIQSKPTAYKFQIRKQMPILSITLTNFRSYSSQKLQSLNPQLNVILGRNGQGKSNLFKALLFLFSDKIQFNQAEKSNLVHNGMNSQGKRDLEVEVILSNKDRRLPVESDTVRLSRRWTSQDKQSYLIDNKSSSKSQIASLIDCLGLVYTNPYNCVQQGKVAQIASMDDHELYKLLQESTGVRKYYQKRQETLNNLAKLEKEKVEAQHILEDLEEKLRAVESRKAEFEAFERDNQVRRRRAARELEQRLVQLTKSLNQCKGEYVRAVRNMEELQKEKTGCTDRMEEIKQKTKLLTDKILFYSGQEAQPDDVKLHSEEEYQEKEEQLKRVMAKEKNMKEKLAKSEEQLNQAKQSYEKIKEKYDSLRLDLQIANNAQRQKLITSTLRSYQQDIASKKQSISQSTSTLSKLQPLLQKRPKSSLNLPSQRSTLCHLTQQLTTYKSKLRQLKLRQVQSNRRLNQHQIELYNNKALFDRLWMKFSSRVAFLVNFDLMAELRRRRLRGVYGYLVDYLRIHEDVSFAYDIANRNRFFAILVEDGETAREVIKVNKEIRGKQVNIYTLEALRREPEEYRKYPSGQDVYPLTNPNWLQVVMPPHPTSPLPSDLPKLIQKLSSTILNKYLLVKDYQSALTLSKQYHLNCITPDRQIVYADAFLCRVGREQHTGQCRLLSYQRLVGKKRELEQLEELIQRETKEHDEVSNREMEVVRMQRTVEIQCRRLQEEIREADRVEGDYAEMENQRNRLLGFVDECKKQIEKMQKSRDQLLSKRTKKIQIPSNSPQIQQQHKKQHQLLSQLMSSHYAVQLQLKQLTQSKHNLQQTLLDAHQQDQQSKASISLNPKHTLTKLKRQLGECQRQLQDLGSTLLRLSDHQEKLEQEKAVHREMMSNFEQECGVVVQKRREMGGVVEGGDNGMEVEQEEEGEHEESRQDSRKRIYTARDRMFFSRFAEIHTKYREFVQRMRDIAEGQAGIHQLLAKCDQQATDAMASIANNFQRFFTQILRRIVPQSTCQVKLLKIPQRNDKVRNGLDIKISFDGRAVKRKWTELSGGQKTIIALSVIMAIQQCDPAPFYIFDEVDSALDTTYRSRIAELFLERSQTAQYFITSFKPEMIQFDQSDCTYFEVTNQNRVSSISQISRDKAQTLVNIIQRDDN